MEKEHKKVRLPTFVGESCDYQMPWIRFKAHSKVSEFDKILKSTIELHMPKIKEVAESLDETSIDDKKKLKVVKRCYEEMANFTLVFTTNELLNKIMIVQTTERPEGLVSIVVKELQNKHKIRMP